MAKNSMDEVEEMLRAAEDDLLLRLARNTHTTHKQQSPISSLSHPDSSPSPFLQSDLASRFDALKASNAKSTGNTYSSPSAEVDLTGDLVARFEALKTTGKSAPPPPPPAAAVRTHPVVSSTDRISDEITSNKEEDEVEKVMRWAMDSARLRPDDKSLSTNTSEEDDDDDDDEEEDEEEVEERRKKKNDGKAKAVAKKGKGKDGKKWFFF